ncbi:hypothetical protein BGW36DRAFT_390926 [Talaromyces proteolyticus]|uniref:Uncharacterized protein n=1 Tax=Talaromyces proteolyticus TaxID=1131652 RepID=A0AAD4KDV3_9EURO|nr:uncharacterized protein BGW36DRAFT_390926 [Talaromyces proteolyticus]KAH8689479.1 hypothetical protein BGW36DRAFT_390926 [Talaromyces proteolyticus]
MRILNSTLLLLGIFSSASAGPLLDNLQQSASSLAWSGGRSKGGRILVRQKVAKWSYSNPALATCVVTGGVFIAAPGVVSAPLLTAAGFMGSGVQAGSAGAAVHATIGNVAADSYFAILQSAGAGGVAALGAVNGAIQASGAAIAASSGGLYLKSKL